MQRDEVEIVFKNGSRFNVVAARESSRGGRRHSGLIDEVNKIAFTLLFQYPLGYSSNEC